MLNDVNVPKMAIGQLGEDEFKLTAIISRFVKTNRIADVSNIEGLISIKIPSIANIWRDVAKQLVSKGILGCEEKDGTNAYFFTQEGRPYCDMAYDNDYLAKYFYDDFYKAAEESKAHGRFCEMVYGKNLCQHGMTDMNQVNRLIELLNVGKGSSILEIGCGSGHITEYISDITSASITGIDISSASINMAKDRTQDKRNRLNFKAMNIYGMEFDENSFDRIISIDALFFAYPFEDVVERMVRFLKPGGQMFIFYFYPPDAEKLRFSEELDRLNMKYETIDLTKENYEHWKLKENTLLGLKTKFDEEGSSFLYNNRMTECSGNLCDFKRYMYIVYK